jgi:hypothetical protein
MDLNSFAFHPSGAPEEGEPLHALDWAGLVARLGAERDLRRELSSRLGAAGDGASFAGAAVWALEGPAAGGEPVVNPEGLADGKATGGITPATGEQSSAAGSDARGHK